MCEECFVVIIKGLYFLVDQEDINFLRSGSWGVSCGYARESSGNKRLLHRLIAKPKCDEYVDHIDGNIRNNCRMNLRICSHSQNMKNRKTHSNNSSGAKGVYRVIETGRWAAQIRNNGKKYFLGSFITIEEASAAYQLKAVELHKDFCRL